MTDRDRRTEIRVSTSTTEGPEVHEGARPEQTLLRPRDGHLKGSQLRVFECVWKVVRVSEDVVWGIVAFLLAVTEVLITPVILFGERAPAPTLLDTILRYTVAPAMCILNCMFLYALYRSRDQRPYAPQVALAMPQLPLFLRPFAGLFWGAHVFLTLPAVWASHVMGADLSFHLRLLILVLGGFCSFWGFGYLLLMVSAFNRSPRAIGWVWHYRFWYVLAIVATAVCLPYFGFMQVTGEMEVLTPRRVTVVGSADAGCIEIMVRNKESKTLKIAENPDWNDFNVRVMAPGGLKMARKVTISGAVLGRTDDDYRSVSPGETIRLCTLRFVAGTVLGSPADWQNVGEGGPPEHLPFQKAGRYHLILEYEDRAGVNRGAVSSLPETVCTVVIESTHGKSN